MHQDLFTAAFFPFSERTRERRPREAGQSGGFAQGAGAATFYKEGRAGRRGDR